VDPDFDEVRGVIGVFPVSHLKKRIDLRKKYSQAFGFTGLFMPPFEPPTFCSKGGFPPAFCEIQAVDPGTETMGIQNTLRAGNKHNAHLVPEPSEVGLWFGREEGDRFVYSSDPRMVHRTI